MSAPPLVSCIMPTADRREFVPRAIAYFLRQDYPEKELLILDDGGDSVADLVPADPRIRYVRETRRRNVGAKRNALCELAQGEFIVHWDDDDWSASNRLSLQVEASRRSEADICGLNRVFFLADDTCSAWEYVYQGIGSRWVCGSSLCYTKNFWRRTRFSDIAVGEDTRFVWADRTARIVAMPDNRFLVALVHQANTSPKRLGDPAWRVCDPDLIRQLMESDWGYYTGAASGDRGSAGGGQTEAQPLPPPPAQAGSRSVSIGIHVTDDGARLSATCAAIEAHTDRQTEVLLLADGADPSAEAAIAQWARFRRVGFAARRGAPACFNLLAREGRGDILVFIESGALPGPGWLQSLSLALARDPANGLAGPSTNLSWNMQRAFPYATAADLSATARTAQNRFAEAVRTMEPLYCLADFCYAVRREVVETIGAADEAYGEGPCWEMDYSVRAVRAGWRPVWAQSAYVFRMPFTPQRLRQEAARFEANRRRYQDKFCARQLTGATAAYNPHCRGEQCGNFAPRGRIAITIPLAGNPSASLATACAPPEPDAMLTHPAPKPPRPLVSCIMPTRNRRPFIPLVLQCFDAQDYEPRELVIIDDGDDAIEDLATGHAGVRYHRLSGRHSIGTKRNLACQLAQGAVVVHWDDDDWYGPHRIVAQVEPILSGAAQITGLDARWILNLDSREFWSLSAALHERMFAGNIHGGTLAYARGIWETGPRFPDVNLAEDAFFLNRALQRGARLMRVSNDNLFVYMRHGRNAWKFETGCFLETQGWQRIDPPEEFSGSLVDVYVQAMSRAYA